MILEKIRKILVSALVVLVSGVLILIIGFYAENYYDYSRRSHGYCTWEEGKEGIRLTKEQRRDLAISRFLQDQTSVDYREIELAEEQGRRRMNYWEYFKDNFTLMRYSNKEELLKENVQCCAQVGVDIRPPSGDFWDWENNPGTSVFEIKHRIRYADKSGSLKEVISSHTYFAVDNCGGVEPVFPF